MKCFIHIKSKLPLWYLLGNIAWWLILFPVCIYYAIDFNGFDSWLVAVLLAALIPIVSLIGFVNWIDEGLDRGFGTGDTIYEYKIQNLKFHLRWRRRK